MERTERKVVVGVVVGKKMKKTISVRVERLVKHERYGKYLRRYSKLLAHDEREEASTGDKVMVMETRPISKTKHWRLVSIVGKADQDAKGE